MALLLDTGPLYALADEDDAWHERVRDFLSEERQPLLVPVLVVAEAAYLIRKRLGAAVEARFVESLETGELTVEGLGRGDLARCRELLETWSFLGLVDASVVALAERLKLTAIVTTDRRDFSRVRPRHAKRFELLP